MFTCVVLEYPFDLNNEELFDAKNDSFLVRGLHIIALLGASQDHSSAVVLHDQSR